MELQCPICLNYFLELHAHHICPVGLGGPKDGPLLDLCSACHLSLHHQAVSEYKNKKKNYLLPDQITRARPYIDVIKKATDIYERTVDKEHILKKIMVEIEQRDLTRVHKRKASLGFKSVDEYLKYLIKVDINKL